MYLLRGKAFYKSVKRGRDQRRGKDRKKKRKEGGGLYNVKTELTHAVCTRRQNAKEGGALNRDSSGVMGW